LIVKGVECPQIPRQPLPLVFNMREEPLIDNGNNTARNMGDLSKQL